MQVEFSPTAVKGENISGIITFSPDDLRISSVLIPTPYSKKSTTLTQDNYFQKIIESLRTKKTKTIWPSHTTTTNVTQYTMSLSTTSNNFHSSSLNKKKNTNSLTTILIFLSKWWYINSIGNIIISWKWEKVRTLFPSTVDSKKPNTWEHFSSLLDGKWSRFSAFNHLQPPTILGTAGFCFAVHICETLSQKCWLWRKSCAHSQGGKGGTAIERAAPYPVKQFLLSRTVVRVGQEQQTILPCRKRRLLAGRRVECLAGEVQ